MKRPHCRQPTTTIRIPVTSQRRGAFLLGALVGDIGSYQEYSEDRSTTLVDQYPVKSITRSRIKKVTQETVAKTLTYTRQEKNNREAIPARRRTTSSIGFGIRFSNPIRKSGKSKLTISASITPLV